MGYMSQARVGGGSNDNQHLDAGVYLSEVKDMRLKDTRKKGMGFFIDMTTTEGPMGAGVPHCFQVYPDDAKTSGKLSKAEVRELELGKMQVASAAVLGISKAEAGKVDDEMFDDLILHNQTDRKVSIANGNKVCVVSVRYQKPDKTWTGYLELYPASEYEARAAAYVPDESAPAARPATKPAPTPPAIKKPAVFPPAGWTVHPDDADYVYNEEECITADELKARLK